MILIDCLKTATLASQKGRFYKFICNPRKFIDTECLKKNGVVRLINTKTFFNRTMRVVLPEPISVRIWRYGIFESDVAYYLLSSLRSGDTFIDIGGHFGFFSMLGRELVGPTGTVVTFEPMPKTREVLIHNLEKNAAPAKQHIVPAAAGAKKGRINFHDFGLAGSAFSTSGIVRNQSYKSIGTVDVDVFRLDDVTDDLGLKSCKLLKIDAENAEMEVVKGSAKMISALKPNIILETGDDEDGKHLSRPVIELLLSIGYQPFEFKDWTLSPHQLTEVYGYQNLLLVHKEREHEISLLT